MKLCVTLGDLIASLAAVLTLYVMWPGAQWWQYPTLGVAAALLIRYLQRLGRLAGRCMSGTGS